MRFMGKRRWGGLIGVLFLGMGSSHSGAVNREAGLNELRQFVVAWEEEEKQKQEAREELEDFVGQEEKPARASPSSRQRPRPSRRRAARERPCKLTVYLQEELKFQHPLFLRSGVLYVPIRELIEEHLNPLLGTNLAVHYDPQTQRVYLHQPSSGVTAKSLKGPGGESEAVAAPGIGRFLAGIASLRKGQMRESIRWFQAAESAGYPDAEPVREWLEEIDYRQFGVFQAQPVEPAGTLMIDGCPVNPLPSSLFILKAGVHRLRYTPENGPEEERWMIVEAGQATKITFPTERPQRPLPAPEVSDRMALALSADRDLAWKDAAVREGQIMLAPGEGLTLTLHPGPEVARVEYQTQVLWGDYDPARVRAVWPQVSFVPSQAPVLLRFTATPVDASGEKASPVRLYILIKGDREGISGA